MNHENKYIGRRIVGVIQTILTYLLAAAIIIGAIFFAMDKSPQKSVFGFRYYTVLTPSMTPVYNVGDVVIVKLSDADAVSVGDVITFNPSTDTTTYLTHRVVEKFDNYEGSNITCFRTKGDANDDADSMLIESSRVIGKVVFSIPKIGYFIRFVQLRWYIVIPLVVMFMVLLALIHSYCRVPDEGDKDSDDIEYSEKEKDTKER